MENAVLTQKSDFEIISPDGEVYAPPKFRGIVVSVHAGFNGYSYIGHVKRGTETINTNGDVFVPRILQQNDVVEFDQLNEDPKRVGKFRTEDVRLITDLVVQEKRPISAIIRSLSDQKTTYHRLNAKVLEPIEVDKAAENKPFVKMINVAEKITEKSGTSEEIVGFSEKFLQCTFANLLTYGMNFSITNNIDYENEKVDIENAIQKFKKLNMEGSANALHSEYVKFIGVRKSFNLMYSAGILKLDSIIPMEYLPDLFVTAPVWFVHGKSALNDQTAKNDPEPDDAVRYFCDLVSSQEFAWLYQIYNRRTRPFKYFESRDIMPLPLVEVFESAKSTFDYLVIATPYHDIASTEWADPTWQRNIDPYLIGFMKGVPFMFLLGRWSATGLFPNMLEMVADTINHLRTNKHMLGKFPKNTYWYKGNRQKKGEDDILQGSSSGDGHNTVLAPFAQQVINAFEEGRLFTFLRGETTPVLT